MGFKFLKTGTKEANPLKIYDHDFTVAVSIAKHSDTGWKLWAFGRNFKVKA